MWVDMHALRDIASTGMSYSSLDPRDIVNSVCDSTRACTDTAHFEVLTLLLIVCSNSVSTSKCAVSGHVVP